MTEVEELTEVLAALLALVDPREYRTETAQRVMRRAREILKRYPNAERLDRC